MISMDCSHPDIEDFINIKSDLDRVTKANISVKITDDFMKAVMNDEDYTLTFTRESTGETIERTLNAKTLFQKLAHMNWDYAEPGCLFWDRINNWNLLSATEEFSYAGTNPCVTGDTKILTDKGYVEIQSVVGQEVNVWNGYEFSKVTPRITGHDQPMKRITFSDGSVLDCTHYHKFILNDNTRIEAKDLKIDDKLIKCNFPVIQGDKHINGNIAYTQGFFMGDGCSETKRDRQSIKLYGDKRQLIDHLAHTNVNYCPSFDGEFLTLTYAPDLYNKTFVPDATYDVHSRLNWLAGYIDSDGSRNDTSGSITISSIDKNVLHQVKYMLNTLGVNSTVTTMKHEHVEHIKGHDYQCKESYRIIISAANVHKLCTLGLNTHRVDLSTNVNRDASRFIKIVNIQDIENCETVYCFNEPLNHSGIFNGVITAQCAEEPLPAGGSCLLGSLNLAEFVNEDKSVNTEALASATHIAVIALNEVLDEGLMLHPLKIQQESVRDWRQIGLGIFGFADMLIKMGVQYGSTACMDVINQVGSIIINTAIIASSLLAKEHGSYPKYKYEDVYNSEFFQNMLWEGTQATVQKAGLRNSQLLTIAPTGSLSTMLGVSGGIEPIYANYYERKTESLHGEDVYYKVYTPIVQNYMEEHGLTDDSQLPDYFVTAQTLAYKNRIDTQSTWQDYIDAAISSTVNVPNNFTKEEVEDLYLYAWQRGLKGVTIFRDGCKRSGILSVTPTKEEPTPNETKARGEIIQVHDNVIGKKRKLTTGCGSLHCTAFFDPTSGDLLEVYLSKGSTGGCNNFMIGLSRMISVAARSGCSIHDIIDQLSSSGSCPSYAVRSATKRDTSKGSCCPMAIGNALRDMYYEMQSDLKTKAQSKSSSDLAPGIAEDILNPCPICGEELAFEGGCNICKSCGWTKCD